ncbi:MAG: hypothetical protein ACJ74H_03895 [Thermoanaerobaculia bacterium]
MRRYLITLIFVALSMNSAAAQTPEVEAVRADTDEEAQRGAPPAPEPVEERRLRFVSNATTVQPRLTINSESAVSGTNGEIFVAAPPAGYDSQGVLLSAFANTPDLGMKLGGTTSAADFSIFTSAGANLFTVRGDGIVSVGTTTPGSGKLYVFDTRDAGVAIQGSTQTSVESAVSQVDIGGVFYAYQSVASGIQNFGKAEGIVTRGYLNGPGKLESAYGVMIDAGVASGKTGTVQRAIGVRVNVTDGDGLIESAWGVYIEDVEAQSQYGIFQAGTDDRNYFGGKVGIGIMNPTRALEVAGDAHFTGTVTGGNIRAKYQDVAEWVPATADLTPGTVVVLNPHRANEVMMSATAYDTTVAGVVSDQPGLSLGEEGEGKEQIATTGRVKMRVDARNGAIRIGDLLVTSDVAGTAMRSQPMSINGRTFHQPGTIIGKALENLESGTGEILVLLSMQ